MSDPKPQGDSPQVAVTPVQAVMQGIAQCRVIAAVYNRVAIKLAPYALFERHGDYHVAALNLQKKASDSEGPKLGKFKLAGLSAIEVTGEEFARLAFDYDLEIGPENTIIFKI